MLLRVNPGTTPNRKGGSPRGYLAHVRVLSCVPLCTPLVRGEQGGLRDGLGDLTRGPRRVVGRSSSRLQPSCACPSGGAARDPAPGRDVHRASGRGGRAEREGGQ